MKSNFNVYIIWLTILACLILGNSYCQNSQNTFENTTNHKFKVYERIDQLLALSTKAGASDPSKAIVYSKEALRISDSLKTDTLKAKSFEYLAAAYYAAGNHKAAMENALECLRISENYPLLQIRLPANSLIGVLYGYKGNYPLALKYFDDYYIIAEKRGLKNRMTSALKLKMWIANLKGDYSKSVQYGEKALLLNDHPDITFYPLLAVAYGGIGAFDKGIHIADSALQVSERERDLNGIGESARALGFLYKKKEDLNKAMQYFILAAENFKKLGLTVDVESSYSDLSEVYYKLGNYRKAYETKNLVLQYHDTVLLSNNIEEAKSRFQEAEEKLRHENEKILLLKEQQFKTELYESDKKSQKVILYSIITGLLLVVVFSFNLYRRFKITKEQKRIIEAKEEETSEQKKIIEEKQKDILDSIKYAERIQRSFIATKEMLDENLNDYFVLFKPKDVVSGDFYWAAILTNGKFAIATADSTGHGVPGAIMSLLNITSLEKAIETNIAPSEILNATRKTIIERLKKDGSAMGGKDGMDCSLCVYDFKNLKLQIAAANNPVWIVRGVEVIEVKADKMPVGKHDRQDNTFTEQIMDLQKGDVVYTLTDGYPDQFGGALGKKFMNKKLRELLAKNSQLPMHQQKEILERTFTDWVGDLEQVDDVMIVGLRV
ncbi:MAG: SpoIIE family protein phosphatase [Sphingobacteriaceae bacterium]|nr:SpoIIE family protein phosphatase [Sphingobacteriaceae bacterium]MBK7817046.1 SpoIIE family protein phosphatase [Sphingobacteriaceae bacterium]